jgi:predicted  nucleic acid-binding Zn-ribbon protein
MQPRSLDDRVSLLENKMQGLDERVGNLEIRVTELTDQFVQFRQEVRGEFSAVRSEMATLGQDLRQEIREGDEETRKLMRILHGDLVARIALLARR